ncbi:redoxin domain-containing protein [Sphingobacterium tabacisoli]|uniref:Redoxin domain-containing protein n=1 Tax=Sphingobacterium tabacisoli TaxID=2044855 RepID=A0ABW5L9E0_9SPHI|nr:redoxin domain-containing protein [Sphingobacterium tabacisoli]
MVKYTLIILLNFLALHGFSQKNHPVSWKIDSVEIAPLTYKVQLHATVKAPYHIYPQNSSGGGLGMPTEITFADDPNVEFVGKVEEKGLADTEGKRVPYYKQGVTFSQVIRLKSDKAVSLAIKLRYMACNDQMCLPPSSKQFTLMINGEDTGEQTADIADESITKIVTLRDYEDFEMADIEGNTVSSKDITRNSKYTFIDFWASWCAPCRVQGRALIPLYNKYQATGFEVIGVSLDTKADAWKKAIQQDGYTWTNLGDLKGFDSPMVKKYNIVAIPRNFIVDSKGTVVAQDLHGTALEAKLKELFGH